jgi:hypothetical protein
MAKARRQKRSQPEGPYLDAALICEQFILEKDGAGTPVRLVNRLTVHDTAPETGALLLLPLQLFVSFKAGGFVGSRNLSLHVVGPSGKRHDPYQIGALEFQGGDTGVAKAGGIGVPYDTDGTYWLGVALDETLYSRIPLTLSFDNQPS